jgi:hypothetical protein
MFVSTGGSGPVGVIDLVSFLAEPNQDVLGDVGFILD